MFSSPDRASGGFSFWKPASYSLQTVLLNREPEFGNLKQKGSLSAKITYMGRKEDVQKFYDISKLFK